MSDQVAGLVELCGASEESDAEVVIQPGTFLKAKKNQRIYASPTATYEETIGSLEAGQVVLASGPPVSVDDYVMVPIKPEGAICKGEVVVLVDVTKRVADEGSAAAEFRSRDDLGKALFKAIKRKDSETVRRELKLAKETGLLRELLTCDDGDSMNPISPFMAAVTCSEIVDLFIEAAEDGSCLEECLKFQVEGRGDFKRSTVFHYCWTGGDTIESLNQLLTAAHNAHILGKVLQAKNKYGETPLELARSMGHSKEVIECLERNERMAKL